MGGGITWRGVSRLVSPAVRGASSASANSSCSFCKVGASSQAPKAQSAHLGSCACAPETTLKAGRVRQQGAPSLWEPDEWEFVDEDERVDHLVFGTLPSRAEVEQASLELQDAVRLGLVAPTSDQSSGSRPLSPRSPRSPRTPGSPRIVEETGLSGLSGESSVTRDHEGDEVSKPLVATRMALDWMEPAPLRQSQGEVQSRGGRNNVAEAFHQFQHNPDVQNMVMSLATDQAVWDAVLANEQIQEFKRKLRGDSVLLTDKDPVVANSKVVVNSKDEPNIIDHLANIFVRCQSFCQSKVSQFMDVVGNIINGLFKAADTKVFAEEDGDFRDRAVKSCTMLALIVVCVVLLKRLAVQAA